ncbi:MAG: hypothetical protein J6P03_03215 [Opitutales bacterium]|nr:hypothetical protein [Opitutales bacterium]
MKIETDKNLGCFEYLFPKGKYWFSPKEVGEIIGRSDQFVRNIFHSGKILGHHENGSKGRGEEKRVYMRIHKRMVMLYLLETANYDGDYFLEILKGVVGQCSEYELFVMEKFVKDQLYRPFKRNN